MVDVMAIYIMTVLEISGSSRADQTSHCRFNAGRGHDELIDHRYSRKKLQAMITAQKEMLQTMIKAQKVMSEIVDPDFLKRTRLKVDWGSFNPSPCSGTRRYALSE